jgi:hypothetical protein
MHAPPLRRAAGGAAVAAPRTAAHPEGSRLTRCAARASGAAPAPHRAGGSGGSDSTPMAWRVALAPSPFLLRAFPQVGTPRRRFGGAVRASAEPAPPPPPSIAAFPSALDVPPLIKEVRRVRRGGRDHLSARKHETEKQPLTDAPRTAAGTAWWAAAASR